ncbi:hypothetical protein Leryth_021609 [Lithospermum erythrorhizon]|nr:hypothetical protein Leryth_021609 [Lithospermum erythrorhizon]
MKDSNLMSDSASNAMTYLYICYWGLAEVSKLGFGCMGLTGVYNNPLPEDEGVAIMKEAFHGGVTFFDTSDVYGADHANEYLAGKAMKQLPREKIQLATKLNRHNLKCLGVDCIDLYYIHRIDTTVPIEETMTELKKLVEEGKIKYIGLSEANANTIKRAHAVDPITAVQNELSLWTRDVEEEIIPCCRELGIGVYLQAKLLWKVSLKIVIWYAMFFENVHPRFTGENFEKNKQIYFRLESLAKKHGCTPAQLAVAWVLHQGDDVVPIPGTTKIRNLHDNIGSVKVKLGEDDLKELSDAVPIDEVAGPPISNNLYRTSFYFSDTPLPKK